MTDGRISDVPMQTFTVNVPFVSEKDVRSGPSDIRTRDADGQGSRIVGYKTSQVDLGRSKRNCLVWKFLLWKLYGQYLHHTLVL